MIYEANYLEQLEQKWNEYIESVITIGKCEFEFEIKPWIDKYHLKFYSGMGGWWIDATEETPEWFVYRYQDTYYKRKYSLDKDKLPEKIQKILNAEVKGMPANDLGSLLPDYPTPE